MGKFRVLSTILVSTTLYLYLQVISTVGSNGQTIALRTKPENFLQIQKGLPFKVALFSDLHFGENAWTDWGPQQDVNSVKVMSCVLDKENPDFVIYLGDVITANNIPIANASLYWNQAISPTTTRGIPFASVFGNHDDALFQWPIEWFSASGIPRIRCPFVANYSFSGEKQVS